MRNLTGYSFEEVVLTKELMEQFLEEMNSKGFGRTSLETYRNRLNLLYKLLPEDKCIRKGTVEAWQQVLCEKGYAMRTVNNAISVANSFLAWLGRRELQAEKMHSCKEDVQPELTRKEYLRFLSTAINLGKEQAYLLIKIFATTSITLQELQKLTVESVRENRVLVRDHGCQRMIHIPACVRSELLCYAAQKGIYRGPIFVTKAGKPLKRTSVSSVINRLCHDAQVPKEKGNPRCLKRLYQTTQAGIEANIALLVEQAHDNIVEREQLSIGWSFENVSGL